MKKGFFDRRIPTVFALFLLVGGLAVTMLLINQGVFTSIQATPEQEPKNVTVTNISDTSFTVAFTTLEKTVAGVSISVDGEEKLLFDNRDGNEKKAYYSHEITINNLSPNSNYGYKILSNGTSYPVGEELFQARTFGKITPTPETVKMTGAVILPNGEAGADTMIFITPEGGATASVVTNNKGEYVIPAKLLKNAGGTNYLDPNSNIHLQIRAVQQNFESTVETIFTPNGIIPPISLSQNYEFIAEVTEEILATPSSLFTEPDANISNSLSILIPKKDQTFVDSRPQLTGTAPAGSIVRIGIDGKNTAQLRASPNGNWSFRSSTPLATGAHTLSVTSGGRTTTQSFSVFSSGSQIAQTATPSATLNPTVTATPTVTPTPSAVLTTTPTPTIVQAPTPAPTITSIPIGAPTQAVVSPTTTPASFVPTKIPLPPTGDATQSIFLTGAAVLFIVTGSILFFIF